MQKGVTMRSFHRSIIGIVILLAAVFVSTNLMLSWLYHNDRGRTYRVEINRLQNEIAGNGLENIDMDRYSCIKKVTVWKKDMDQRVFLEGDNSDYVIRYINGVLYRFDYEIMQKKEYKIICGTVNIALGGMAVLLLVSLLYIRGKLLEPFHRLKEVPYELSKGNLSIGLKESKSRYFGRFIWGLDLLRENLEHQKQKELSLQKEKKTLVLSISHDIKTPLSAISLYARALSRNLYASEEKRTLAAESIEAKVKEIEGFVSELMKATSEDFLSLEVRSMEFYISELMDKITAYYQDKLALLKIDFIRESYDNCLIKGDPDRAVEVLQNILENAIKYGDGGYIRLSVSREEDCRLVTVVNSGNTLPENELPHIFESFWRGSNTGNNSGNGLGLYISRQLMMKMDGDIYADCQRDEMRVTVVLRMA
jgi:signal transduction histidine kinase